MCIEKERGGEQKREMLLCFMENEPSLTHMPRCYIYVVETELYNPGQGT